MTAPVPEQHDEPIATAGMGERPREHESDLPDAADRSPAADGPPEAQEENAESSLDEPSDDAGEV